MPESPMEQNRESMERLGIGELFWLTHEAVIGVDLASERIVLWNPSAERIFGYAAAEAIGMGLDTLVPDAYLAAHHAGLDRYRNGAGAQLVGGPPIEVPARRKDGEEVVIALTLTAVDADHRQHVLAVVRDVTASKAADEARRQALEAARAFIAMASHDLRSPLTTIIGYAELLTDDGDVPGVDRRSYASGILGAGDRALLLIDDLLTVSQLQIGAAISNRTVVALESAVCDAVRAAGVEAEVDLVQPLEVFVDSDHLHRILVNLLENASKYGQPPIRISAAPAAHLVEIRVTDGGDGVAPDFVESLFEPFTRAPGSRSAIGSGLGLFIVKGLADLNDGLVRYETDEDGQACFAVDLPSPSS